MARFPHYQEGNEMGKWELAFTNGYNTWQSLGKLAIGC